MQPSSRSASDGRSSALAIPRRTHKCVPTTDRKVARKYFQTIPSPPELRVSVAPAIKVGTINWRGYGTVTYPYELYEISTRLPAVPGNYVWAKRIPDTGKYLPVYVGEAEDLQTRVTPGHERRECAVRAGATHISFHGPLKHSQHRDFCHLSPLQLVLILA